MDESAHGGIGKSLINIHLDELICVIKNHPRHHFHYHFLVSPTSPAKYPRTPDYPASDILFQSSQRMHVASVRRLSLCTARTYSPRTL